VAAAKRTLAAEHGSDRGHDEEGGCAGLQLRSLVPAGELNALPGATSFGFTARFLHSRTRHPFAVSGLTAFTED
jgi:hypothetical protein